METMRIVRHVVGSLFCCCWRLNDWYKREHPIFKLIFLRHKKGIWFEIFLIMMNFNDSKAFLSLHISKTNFNHSLYKNLKTLSYLHIWEKKKTLRFTSTCEIDIFIIMVKLFNCGVITSLSICYLFKSF